VNPQLSPGTAQIIEMLLAKDPADRYRDAGQLLEDLDHAARGESPEHARGTTDLAAVAATIAAAPPPAPTEVARVSGGGQGGKAVLLAALAASVLINLILLIVVLVR
jgi:hypothetical protein